MDRIRVVMADDNPEICEYFAGLLSAQEDMELVATASSGAEAVQLARSLKPDIMLMDIQMETRTAGITAAGLIHREMPEVKVIILTILEDDDLLFQAYCAGVIDYIIKTDASEQIVAAIRNAWNNQLILRPQYAEKIIEELRRARQARSDLMYSLNILTRLSNSEFEVLQCLYSGMNARQIAEERFVSLGTVKTQIHSILQKFGLRSASEVVHQLRAVHFEDILASMNKNS